MTKERSKRQHYIPQFQIRRWANRPDKVWVYYKEKHHIEMTSPRKVFVKNDLYTVQEGLDAPKTDFFEKQFSIEESTAAKITERIVNEARQKRPTNMTFREYFACQTYLLSTVRRTPESQARIRTERDVFLEWLKQLPNAEELGIDDPEVHEELNRDPAIVRVKKMVESNATAKFAAGHLPGHQKEVDEYVSMTGLRAFVILNPERSFLLGSHGYCYATERTKGGRVDSSTWFPIAPDVALTFTGTPNFVEIMYFDEPEREDRLVRRINDSTVCLSDYVVAKDKRLLEAHRKRVLKRLKRRSHARAILGILQK